jgi:multicomponent K+:H+ antiporter subunit D
MMEPSSLPLGAHLIVAPVLLPLVTAALMLFLGESRRRIKGVINLVSTLAGLLLAIYLLQAVHTRELTLAFGVYLPGNWPVPFGIVLVLDRLSALLLVLTGCIGMASLLYALARWHNAGVYFHVLFQLQLMGLYGAFLTADLFNLFVFFEVLLAASYGLLMHGGGTPRVRAGLHYITVNLVASLLFLIGVAVLYGVTGTLNMDDIAAKMSLVAEADRGLLHAGAAILAVAFLAKAALWPLNFWLPGAYGSASAPVAALFAILTKVGVYAVLRLWTLCFPAEAGGGAPFGGPALIWGGVATLGFGAIGMLASQQLGRFAAYSVIASSGTLVAAFGFGAPELAGGALFYLVSSTLAAAALFLLVELLERARQVELGPDAIDDGQDTLPAFIASEPLPGANLDDDEEVLIGRAIPAALAFLGLTFAVCALVVTGLPPLSGFVAKLAMLTALLDMQRPAAWVLFALVLLSGLMAATALLRIGMRHFWTAQARPSPHLRVAETLPIGLLLAGGLILVLQGGQVLDYMRQTAATLHAPSQYISAVQSARPVPSPSSVAPQEARP